MSADKLPQTSVQERKSRRAVRPLFATLRARIPVHGSALVNPLRRGSSKLSDLTYAPLHLPGTF